MDGKILVVDDSFYMRTMLKNILLDAGYEVVAEAPNGASAIQQAHDLKPDLITLDLILPDNTGLEVLKAIREEDKEVKVVIVSAVGQEAIVNEALSAGANAYLVKPFAEEKVLSVISDILKGKASETE